MHVLYFLTNKIPLIMKRLSALSVIFILSWISIFGQADLVVSTAGFQPNSIDKGDIFSVQATVTNVGNTTASANYMFIYYSQDLTVSDEEIISRVSIKELAPNESQVIDFIYPIPSPYNAGDYFLGFEVDPFDDVVETDEDNLFCAADAIGCVTFSISNTTLNSQKYTYPIIFVHGWTGDSRTWDDFSQKADSIYGWSYGGRLDYCLNPDGTQSTSDTEILVFANSNNLSPADYYYLNFDISASGVLYVGNDSVPFNDDLSNQSAITKQGWAVKDAIDKVLDASGAEKVILVGHSMGGLASREYIQNSSNWQSDGNHHVAKLLTIATPNGGSNATGLALGGFFGWDEFSEAVRDLRHDGFPFLYDAEFLFGGTEDNFSVYYNNDVNCNGFVGDLIVGLNEKDSPLDINYSCIVSPNDLVVALDRADLNNYLLAPIPMMPPLADKFTITSSHTSAHKENASTIIQGLDEPAFYDLAYQVPLNSLNFGYSTIQADNNPIPPPNDDIDFDDYKIEITENGLLEVDIWNIPVHGFALFLLDEAYTILEEVQAIGESNIGFQYQVNPGTYYIELASIPTPGSWGFPYAYSIAFTPAIPLVANFSSNTQAGCEPFSVNFSNQSTGNINNYQWTFEGGTPSSSSNENPTVTYSNAGEYSVTLTITDDFGNNTITQTDYVTVNSIPQAQFTFDTQLDEVIFTNQSQFDIDTPTYSWDFGDGATSSEESPTHIFQNDGTYNIQLTATNSCGSTAYNQTVTIMTVATEDLKLISEISIFPNPSKDRLTLKIEGQYLGRYDISLINSIGQKVRQFSKTKNGSELEFEMNTFDLPSGSYFIQINSEKESQIRKIIKL